MAIVEKLTKEYINSFVENKDRFPDVKKEADELEIPAVTIDMGIYLSIMASSKEVYNILEIGSGNGYSTLWLNEGIKNKLDSTIYTFEHNPDRYEKAVSNFKKYHCNKINHSVNSFFDDIDKINEKFDLVFIDGMKNQYENYFLKSFEKLNKGGLIISDNIFFRGNIFLNEDEIDKKYKNISRTLNSYIDFLKNFKLADTIIMPFSDGIAISRKL